MPPTDPYRTAFAALAALVAAEYPDGYTMGNIVREWGGEYGLTEADAEAVDHCEQEQGKAHGGS